MNHKLQFINISVIRASEQDDLEVKTGQTNIWYCVKMEIYKDS
jgi:hypothetical protein